MLSFAGLAWQRAPCRAADAAGVRGAHRAAVVPLPLASPYASNVPADIVCDLDTKSFLDGSWTITNTKLYDEYTRWWETQHFPANKTQKVKAALGQWLRYKVKEEGGFKNDPTSRSSTYHFDNKLAYGGHGRRSYGT